MSGVYVHIPYCKQKCSYCNFHFSTSLSTIPVMVKAINREIEMRKNEISEPLNSLYIGGGTPSLLEEKELKSLFETVHDSFDLSELQEVTLECNPDDINLEKLNVWRDLGVNRLSIGVQSFFDEELILMNRSHTARQSYQAVRMAQNVGFENITIDLIYGSPVGDFDTWSQNLEIVQSLNIPHFSAYALTVENRTLLAHQIASGKLSEVPDEQQLIYFEQLQAFAKDCDYIQYEISNFALEGNFSIHNSSYWQGKPYLGIGPSAHSFDGAQRRSCNVANNALYLRALQKNELPQTSEVLSSMDKYNELIMIGLRSIFGIAENEIHSFPPPIRDYFFEQVQKHLDEGVIIYDTGTYYLHKSAYFKADGISADLFYIDDDE